MSESPTPSTSRDNERMATILRRLLEVRSRQQWSQSDMAAHLNLTEEAYRALEKGRTIRLEWNTIARLLDILEYSGLNIDWLLGRGAYTTAASPPAWLGATEAAPPLGEASSRAQTALRDDLQRATARLFETGTEPPPVATTPPALPPPVHKAPRPRRRRGFRLAVSETGLPLLELNTVAAATQPNGLIVPEAAGLAVMRIRVIPTPAAGSVAVRIQGQRLPAGYFDGDAVICEPGLPVADTPGLIVLRSGHCLLATWRRDMAGRFRANPLDAGLAPLTVLPDEVATIYRVTRIISRDQLPPKSLDSSAAGGRRV